MRMPLITVGYNYIMSFKIVAYLLFALCCITVQAQRKQFSRTAIDSLLMLKRMENSHSVLRFSSYKYDMGAMYEEDSVKDIKFVFRNVSDSVVRISKVTTSCGCTVAYFNDNETILPGDYGDIVISFNPKGRIGTIDTDAFIYLHGSSTPVARLVIYGTVIGDDEWQHLPMEMGKLRLKRKSVAMGVVNGGTTRIERVACANAGVNPLKISATILPSYVTLATIPSVLQPGEEGDLLIAVDVNDFYSLNNDTVRLKIPVEGVDCRPSERIFNILIYKDKRK